MSKRLPRKMGIGSVIAECVFRFLKKLTTSPKIITLFAFDYGLCTELAEILAFYRARRELIGQPVMRIVSTDARDIPLCDINKMLDKGQYFYLNNEKLYVKKLYGDDDDNDDNYEDGNVPILNDDTIYCSLENLNINCDKNNHPLVENNADVVFFCHEAEYLESLKRLFLAFCYPNDSSFKNRLIILSYDMYCLINKWYYILPPNDKDFIAKLGTYTGKRKRGRHKLLEVKDKRLLMQFTTNDILKNMIDSDEGIGFGDLTSRFKDSLKKVICETIESQYDDIYSHTNYISQGKDISLTSSLTQLIRFSRNYCGKPNQSFLKYINKTISDSQYNESDVRMSQKQEKFYITTKVNFYDLTYFDQNTPETDKPEGNLFTPETEHPEGNLFNILANTLTFLKTFYTLYDKRLF